MNPYTRLGRLTAAKTAAAKAIEKKAGPLGAIGGLVDKGLGAGARLIGKGFKAKGMLPKALTGAGVALGGSAINEGLGYHGYNPVDWDNDSMWSPNSQAVRQQNAPTLAGQAREFFKRPIQSLMSSGQMTDDHNAYMARRPRIPRSAIKGWKMGPDGKMMMDVSGPVEAPFEQSYLDMIKNQKGMRGMPGMLGQQTAGNSGQNGDKVKYIFGTPSLPGSSNF